MRLVKSVLSATVTAVDICTYIVITSLQLEQVQI